MVTALSPDLTLKESVVLCASNLAHFLVQIRHHITAFVFASGERFEFARKLKLAMEDLRAAGERLSKYELEKRHAIHLEDYERAKVKKAQMDEYRRTVYQFLEVDDLLEISGVRSDEAFNKM
jgi:hypothetical protein